MNILDYFDFVKEGLITTHDAEHILRKHHLFIGNLKISYKIEHFKSNNTILLTIYNFNKIQNIINTIECIDSFMVNMMGWFSSSMILESISGMKNELKYNYSYLIDNCDFIDNVKIIYESKYDILKDMPKKLYHLSISEFENSILKNGIFPKSRNKLSLHPDRVYVCSSIILCKSLIFQMKSSLKKWNRLNKIDDRWVIFEIDTDNINSNLYCDPNYSGGYYITKNISPADIKIIERE